MSRAAEALQHTAGADREPGEVMRRSGISAGQRTLFYTFFVLEHFLGRKNLDKVLGRARRRLKERMLERVRRGELGKAVPLARHRDLSKKDFLEKYARRGIPVVFEGAARDWPCVRQWSLEYFAERFGDDDVVLSDAEGTNSNPLDAPFELTNLHQLIEHIDEGGLKYARFHPLLQRHPELREELDLGWMREHMYGRTKWMTFYGIFLGGQGTNTGIHNAVNDNLFTQIEGRKRWILWPLEQTPWMDIEANRAPYKECGLLPDDPDHDRYPMYKHLDFWETVLEPGDVLYNPPYVWHHVTNLTRSIGLACRWTNLLTGLRQQPVLATLELFNTRPNVIKAILGTLDDFNKVLISTRGEEKAFKKALLERQHRA